MHGHASSRCRAGAILTYAYCQGCGESARHRADEAPPDHIANHCATSAWKPDGSDQAWDSTWWQAKRVVLIRDSIVNPDDPANPWKRHPKCQGCGHVWEDTVDGVLQGQGSVAWGVWNGKGALRDEDWVEIQHIKPRQDGGTNHPSNLAVLCRRCHVRTFKRGYAGVPTTPYKQRRLP